MDNDVALRRQAEAEGYRACRSGKSNIDNPYTNDDGLAEAWNDGWFARCDDEAEAAENCMGF